MIGYSADGLVKVLEVEYSNPDRVKFQYMNDEPQWSDITTGPDGDAVFSVGELIYGFSEIVRCENEEV